MQTRDALEIRLSPAQKFGRNKAGELRAQFFKRGGLIISMLGNPASHRGRKNQNFGLREFRGARKAGTDGAQSSDWRRDKDSRKDRRKV